MFEVQGQRAVTLKQGEAFAAVAGEVHNVKNASSSAPAKALAFTFKKRLSNSRTSRFRPNKIAGGG